ncbi:hypothetical protein NAEX_01850 [Nannocystis exedens]|nr:hypothetical protein NAEX_01850 [Nannocystis exedens]
MRESRHSVKLWEPKANSSVCLAEVALTSL